MSEGRTLYRLDDLKRTGGVFEVTDWVDADHWSKQKWGIFWTVNEFTGPRRKENLKRIISWAVDLDSGTKEEQRQVIKRYPLPSAVIETKRGYHVYYNAINATVENFEKIVSDRLVFLLNADPNAKDISRILRVPTYLHWKDESNPFSVRGAFLSDKMYTEEFMLARFQLPKKETKILDVKSNFRDELKFTNDKELFQRIWSMDCEAALLRISNHWSVNSERYSFRRTGSGNLNIYVNDKPTSCFIDANKRIGSLDKGGPTIWSWVNWFLKDHKKTYQVIKEVFPEVCSGTV